MAGKLFDQQSVDWTPIYLSRMLLDTEFGSLLDITDQILKSLSQAGQVDYLYFDYPLRPEQFPFDKPLSTKVRELPGERAVQLEHSRDRGGARRVRTEAHHFSQPGALPITYGSWRDALVRE